MLGYVMLCYGLKSVRYVMLCYVHFVDCRFYGGASGTLRATARGAELESDGTRCVDLPKVTWRRNGGGGAICVRQQKRGRANTRRAGRGSGVK